MKKTNPLYHIQQLAKTLVSLEESNLDTSDLKSSIDSLLAKWKSNIENKPIKNDDNINSKFALYFILEDEEWIPVRAGEENSQGGLIWTVSYKDGHSETGASRIGRWAHIDGMGLPNIDLTLDSLIRANEHHLK